ncbi:6280_t:CDS:1 [Acaulospora morrowiae]|uniref:6280_t:CDS:1 n=1 Tax=Acaulospora morrowiae TaxID=94023 RepID=A0A9N9GGP4_9GLOM|nr:6280_t:CDS:1 [Acaulospora morrowiae]
MSVEFSLDGLAESLICQLDRNRIFPPHHNDPEELVLAAHSKNKVPKRSPNAFLLCRKNVHKEAKRVGVCNMRVISKVTGILWRNSSVEEKEVYEELAKHIREIYVQRDNANSYYISNRKFVPYPMHMYIPSTLPSYGYNNAYMQDYIHNNVDLWNMNNFTHQG